MTRKTLDFHGKHFSFDNVPMSIEPLQKPLPPLWYGVHSPDSAARAARRSLNVVDLDPTAETRVAIDSYRATWRSLHGEAPLPKLGLGRFIVVAETTPRRCGSHGAPIRSGTKLHLSVPPARPRRKRIRGRPISTA